MGCKFSTGVTEPVPQFVEVLRAPAAPARKFLLERDSPDPRDLYFKVARHSKVRSGELPSKIDLRPVEAFPVYDQGDLCSCTANALAATYHFELLRQGLEGFCPSRLFIYYLQREKLGTTVKDSGASLRSGVAALSAFGVCDEGLWPYDVAQFKAQPTPESYAGAAAHACKKYARVEQDLASLKGCILAGYPFVLGFQVYSNFMEQTQSHGVMPLTPDGELLGGAAVQACGYDDARGVFIVRNSWGEEWGDHGHFYMPYEFITNPRLTHDFWAIQWVDTEFPVEEEEDDTWCTTLLGC